VEFKRALVALVLFGVSFGYVEASLVVYLRDVYDPLTLELDPERMPGDVFPLITLEQLKAADAEYLNRLRTEVVREAATMFMLAAVGLAIGRSFKTCLAGFVVAFGVWDIFYYVFLKVLIDWPASLLEWDILFLIPLPWVAPVLAPVLVAISMIVTGTLVIRRESAGRPVEISWRHSSIIVLGGLIIIVSFCWDYRNILAGGMPNPFQWAMFLVGETVGLAGFSRVVIRSDQRRRRRE
jgi:hypothetical protein